MEERQPVISVDTNKYERDIEVSGDELTNSKHEVPEELGHCVFPSETFSRSIFYLILR